MDDNAHAEGFATINTNTAVHFGAGSINRGFLAQLNR